MGQLWSLRNKVKMGKGAMHMVIVVQNVSTTTSLQKRLFYNAKLLGELASCSHILHPPQVGNFKINVDVALSETFAMVAWVECN